MNKHIQDSYWLSQVSVVRCHPLFSSIHSISAGIITLQHSIISSPLHLVNCHIHPKYRQNYFVPKGYKVTRITRIFRNPSFFVPCHSVLPSPLTGATLYVYSMIWLSDDMLIIYTRGIVSRACAYVRLVVISFLRLIFWFIFDALFPPTLSEHTLITYPSPIHI